MPVQTKTETTASLGSVAQFMRPWYSTIVLELTAGNTRREVYTAAGVVVGAFMLRRKSIGAYLNA